MTRQILIDDAWGEFKRLWTIRIGLFFFMLNGALVGLGAFVTKINPLLFFGLNVVGYGLIGFIRLVKQAPKGPSGPSTDALENQP